ncbi:MAG: DUF3696 domain-containing protein [Albidovulum sp.]|nr:DUF3696 domain-containing protein [Albidovulum sp.]
MIDEIQLENFERFHDLVLKTANLTILTGANSSGKTSVFHALLLARRIARQPENTHVELNVFDDLELGGVEDIINRKARKNIAVVRVLDDQGKCGCWSFGATNNDNAKMLDARIFERPKDLSIALTGPAPQFCYLSAERLGPRAVLGASAVNAAEFDVGPRGEFVAQVLASCGRCRVNKGRIENPIDGTQVVEDLLHQTENWITKIVRPIQIEAVRFPNLSITRLRFKVPGLRGEWTRAPNVGFGISYSLPIVVAALRAEVGGLLLVENPEAHLHPAGQSMIGGFLAQVAADGVQVFLETHSDHVLNGIRLAVANGNAGLSPEQVAIHFFRTEEEEGSILQSIDLLETGQLSTWPTGFFDQAQIDLAALALNRRRKP